MSSKSTLERFKKAKMERDSGKYSSIEDAAKANKLSPASYYNYLKKEFADKGEKMPSGVNISELLRENEQLKAKVVEDQKAINGLQSSIEKLKNKLIDVLLLKE